jgi:hypothetical protein
MAWVPFLLLGFGAHVKTLQHSEDHHNDAESNENASDEFSKKF